MKNRISLSVVVLLIIGLISGILGCAAPTPAQTAQSTTSTPVTTKTLKIGGHTYLTGPAAAWGLEFKRGMELAADDVNARGGLKVGTDRYLIEVICLDNKMQGTEGVAATNRLVFQDGVKFICMNGSVCVLPSLPITEPNKVMSVNGVFAPSAIGPSYPLAFRGQYSGWEAAEGIYGYITTNMKQIKTVACLAPDNDTGKAGAKQSTNVATDAGLKVVDTYFTPIGTTDFYPILSKIMTANPDMIDTDGTPANDLALFAKQAREKGYKGTIIVTASLDVPAVVRIAGVDAAEGIMSPDIDFTGSVATPEQRQFVDNYVKKYGPPFNGLAASLYCLVGSTAAGIEAAQSIDPVKVAEVLPKLTMNLLGEQMTWGGAQRYGINHHIIQPIGASMIKDGKLVTIGKYTPQVP